jgi:hypothetical protein
MADGDGLLVGMLGDDAGIKGANRWVVAHGAESGHPQITADQVVAAPAHNVAFGAARIAVAIDAAGDFDGQHAEVSDEFAGRVEAVDVEDGGGQDGGGDGADAGDGIEMIGRGQSVIGRCQQIFQAFLACATIPQLADLIAHEFLDRGALERGDRSAGSFEQGGDVLMRQVRNLGELWFVFLGHSSANSLKLRDGDTPGPDGTAFPPSTHFLSLCSRCRMLLRAKKSRPAGTHM